MKPRHEFDGTHRLHRFRGLAVFSVWLLLAGSLLAEPISLAVKASRNRIYLGESVQLHVTVSGSNDNSLAPRFPGLKDAELQLLGSQDNSRRSIQIINGRMMQEIFRGRTFVYQLTPKAAGVFQVGAVEMAFNGQQVTARGPGIEVTGIEQRQDITVAIEATRQTILVDEPFSITLRILVAALPAPNEQIEPLLPQQPPHIQADFLEFQELRGLKMPDLKALLEGMIDQGGRTPSFAINNYQSQGMGGFMGMGMGFDSMFEPKAIPFRFPVKRIEHNGKSFWEYRVTLDYSAQIEGDYTFGPATFKGSIIKGGDERGQPILAEIFTVGPAVTVRVVPPPEAGRPEWFVGSVGRNLKAVATLDTAICKVGDPLTLTLDITGEISISNLRPPVLGLQPSLSENFRIYSEPFESETLANGKRFRYRIRPLKSGTLEFPALPIAYFDTVQMNYVTVQTLPLPVQAHATTQIAAVSEDDGEAGGQTQALTAADKQPDGIIVDKTGDPGTRNWAPTPRRIVPWLAVPPLLLVLVALLRTAWRRRQAWSTARRRGNALAQARRCFAKARRTATGDPVAGAILGAQAFRAYFSARFDTHGQGVTASDLPGLFRKQGVAIADDAAVQAHFTELEQLPFRPHAATPEGVDALLTQLLSHLAQIDKLLSRSSPQRRPTPPAALLLGLALLVPPITHASRLPDTFTWERANQAMAGAQTPEDFLAAANIYNDLVKDGARTGPLFYNLGTALLLAGDARNAEAALVRAERHLGATPEIRANLKLAIGARSGQPDAQLPPSRIFLAWHYYLSLNLRIWLVLAGWSILWCGLALRLITPPPAHKYSPPSRRRAFANLLAGWGCALLIVYGGSVAFTLLQEQHDTRFWHERLFAVANSTQPTEDTP
jgi:hypothetical protein